MIRHTLPVLLATCLALPASAFAADSCDDVAASLATMVSADQAIRKRIDFLDQQSPAQQKLFGHMALVDRTNTERLKAIVARCGWPVKEKFGEKAAGDAWLLAQHADQDVPFQKQALVLIEAAAKARGERVDRNFAYLYDRVATAEKRLQRYGTQLHSPSGESCALEFKPMEAREQVEARRAELNLPPLDAYRRLVLEMYHCPAAGSADSHYPQG
ncbi:hypothetical protein LQ564_16080 [Massilia sp. G4R7]|uniref:Uncharacterized protein n=1 Tax=Massilia phyllostachyos TaxID=2898585 RepID=A0ABS8Q7V0_9BURK|nr:DUF6624 domain-containing protein [Massilia phyllostachyos]MCD2517832.1 hypothetical protein [Massilia phyllostachyos]